MTHVTKTTFILGILAGGILFQGHYSGWNSNSGLINFFENFLTYLIGLIHAPGGRARCRAALLSFLLLSLSFFFFLSLSWPMAFPLFFLSSFLFYMATLA